MALTNFSTKSEPSRTLGGKTRKFRRHVFERWWKVETRRSLFRKMMMGSEIRRASCRIRTNDPEITNHVLWPTELKRRVDELSVSRRYNQVPLLCSHPGGFRGSWPYRTRSCSWKSAAKVQQKCEKREVKSEKFADFNDFLRQTTLYMRENA